MQAVRLEGPFAPNSRKAKMFILETDGDLDFLHSDRLFYSVKTYGGHRIETGLGWLGYLNVWKLQAV